MEDTLPSLTQNKYLKPRKEESLSLIPVNREYEQCYTLYRMNLKPIEISQQIRNAILEAMSKGNKHIQIGEYTIMINSITGIEPLEIIKQKQDQFIKKLEWINQ